MCKHDVTEVTGFFLYSKIDRLTLSSDFFGARKYICNGNNVPRGKKSKYIYILYLYIDILTIYLLSSVSHIPLACFLDVCLNSTIRATILETEPVV